MHQDVFLKGQHALYGDVTYHIIMINKYYYRWHILDTNIVYFYKNGDEDLRAVYGGECVTVDSMELTTPDVNLSDAEESTVQPTTIQPVTFQTFIDYDENPESESSDDVTENPPAVVQGNISKSIEQYVKLCWINCHKCVYTRRMILEIFPGDNEFICDNGDILEVSRKCNGYPDCPNGEDEQNCIYNEDLNGGKQY